MNQFLDLEKIFSLASDLRYCAIKIDTPGFKKDFPKSYPLGRDVDIVCHTKDFDKLFKICDNNISYPKDHTRHIIRDSKTQARFRIHAPGYFLRPNPRPTDKMIQGKPWTQLHFQIDITTEKDRAYSHLSNEFLNSLFFNLKSVNGVNVLSSEKESVFRFLSLVKSKRSSHHSDYISRYGSLKILESLRCENFKNLHKDVLHNLVNC